MPLIIREHTATTRVEAEDHLHKEIRRGYCYEWNALFAKYLLENHLNNVKLAPESFNRMTEYVGENEHNSSIVPKETYCAHRRKEPRT